MSALTDWLDAGFQLVLYAATAAAPLALAVGAIDAAIGRKMPARFRCGMWTLVALRLLMPWAPATPFSLHHAWRLASQSTAQPAVAAIHTAAPAAELIAAPAHADDEFARADDAHITAADAQGPLVVAAILPAAWFAGFAFIVLRSAVASVRFARRLRALPAVDDPAILHALDGVCRQLRVCRRPDVKCVPGLESPALFGLSHPTLCLPADAPAQLTAGQLRLIMLHEVMHLRRHDGALAWLLTLSKAVQWFNPFAWLASSRVAVYRELACDEAVRRFAAPDQRRAYADLLLRFAAGRPVATLGLVGLWFARPRRHLAARIAAFTRADAAPHIPRSLLAALLATLALAGLTDAASSRVDALPPQSVSEFMASAGPAIHAAVAQSAGAEQDSPESAIESRTYDISAALRKLREIDPQADARAWLLSYLTLPSWRPQSIESVAGDPDRLQLAMSVRDHAAFAEFLAAVSRTGPWQVTIEMRLLRAPHVDALGNIDWQDAVKFAAPPDRQLPEWPHPSAGDAPPPASLSIASESVSWEYAPYLAFVLDKQKSLRFLDRFQREPRLSISNCPKVTLFSGQRAVMRDESQRPFVVGVHYVKGELAAAAQPDVAVLSEGTAIDVVPRVLDAGALDLQCRLTVSRIDAVGHTRLPGQDVTVENPRATRRTVSARCRVAPGETLVIAPLDEDANAPRPAACFAVTARWFPDAYAIAER